MEYKIRRKMPPLDNPDRHHLQASVGWLELGNHVEAMAELEQITILARWHPDVLEIRWQIFAKDKKWDDCQEIAGTLLAEAPERPEAWLHLAFSVRRVTGGGIQAASDILKQAVIHFPKEPMIFYNLACYTCQLGQKEEAWTLLALASENAEDPKSIKAMALDDPDLEPLWPDIAEM